VPLRVEDSESPSFQVLLWTLLMMGYLGVSQVIPAGSLGR